MKTKTEIKETKYKPAQILQETWDMLEKIKGRTSVPFWRIIHDGVGLYYQAKFIGNDNNERELSNNLDKQL